MKNHLTSRFLQLSETGELVPLLDRRATLNVTMKTAGGRFCWETLESKGWKLQVNLFFGNWRILDEVGNRRAWGTGAKQLESLLFDRPTSALANYLDDGFSFSSYPAKTESRGTVILIHGAGVRAKSMHKLAEMLADGGYEVRSYDYPSSRYPIAEHARIFLHHFRNLKIEGKLFFLTHSMGGIVLRAALSEMSEEECKKIDSIVMLAPPNRGSILALIGKNAILRRFNASLLELSPDEDAYVANIPAPQLLPSVGIIAGAYDGKVSFASTALPEGQSFQRITLPCTHPGLRNPDRVREKVLTFFQEKHF